MKAAKYSRGPSGRPFPPGTSGNPAGKPKGAKDRFPRTARRVVEHLLEQFGSDVPLMTRVLTAGLTARPPSSFPYLRMIVEQQVGTPDPGPQLVTRVVHEHVTRIVREQHASR